MLDIRLFRENPEIIRESQRRRFKPVKIVDEIIDLDNQWQERESELDKLQKDDQKLQQEAQLSRPGGDGIAMTPEKAKLKNNKKKIKTKKEEVQKIKARLVEKLDKVGNLVHESVPRFKDEGTNVVQQTWMKKCVKPDFPNLKTHVQLVELLDFAVLKDGGRGFYLKDKGVLLIEAIKQFALNFLKKKGYKARQAPYYTSQNIRAKLAEVAESNEELYKVIPEGDDKFLTATAEQPLGGLHIGDWIHPAAVPIKYSALTPCLREAGKEAETSCTDGLGQVSQFEKIEQFFITSPNNDDSLKAIDEMIRNSEEFYQILKLPHRVMSVVSGALNEAEAKRYDLETWLPASGTYQKHGCSNCTDYQARVSGIRFGQKKAADQIKQYCHLLNATLSETYMTLCCILESYQKEQGVLIPEVLQSYYMGEETFLPFVFGKKEQQKPNKAKRSKTRKEKN